MVLFDETMVRIQAKAIRLNTGWHADDDDVRSAMGLCRGGCIVAVVDPQRVPWIVTLAAATFHAYSALPIHLAVTDDAESERVWATLMSLKVTERIIVKTAESFAFTYLQDPAIHNGFALVTNAEQVLLRDANTPVILATSPDEGEALGVVDEETRQRAEQTLLRGRDYVVEKGNMIVRDPETGTLFPGRRFSNGLNAAVQAREGIPISKEGEVISQITLGEFFRKYQRLAGVATHFDEQYRTLYGLERA